MAPLHTHVVTISKRNDGFSYDPSTVYVKPGDLIRWNCHDGAFGLSFLKKSPFARMTFSSQSDGEMNFVSPKPVRNEAPLGHYHYAVALAMTNRAGTTVVMDSGCPDIVVSEDGA